MASQGLGKAAGLSGSGGIPRNRVVDQRSGVGRVVRKRPLTFAVATKQPSTSPSRSVAYRGPVLALAGLVDTFRAEMEPLVGLVKRIAFQAATTLRRGWKRGRSREGWLRAG